MKKLLMIHQWDDKYLNLKLDDYILTFDDGLHSQIDGIKKIVNIYPDIEIQYYISTGIINIENVPSTYNDCRTAHSRFFNDNITSDYVTYDDLTYLKNLSNVTIGLHGHKHLNLNHLKKNKSLNDYYKLIEDDIKEMLFGAINLSQFNILNNDIILFCTPYNQLDPLYNAVMRKQFNLYFPKAEIKVIGPGREDIDKLI